MLKICIKVKFVINLATSLNFVSCPGSLCYLSESGCLLELVTVSDSLLSWLSQTQRIMTGVRSRGGDYHDHEGVPDRGGEALGWSWQWAPSALADIETGQRAPDSRPRLSATSCQCQDQQQTLFNLLMSRTGDNAQVTLLNVKSELFVKRSENSATPNTDSWLIQEVMNKRKEGLELNGKNISIQKLIFWSDNLYSMIVPSLPSWTRHLWPPNLAPMIVTFSHSLPETTWSREISYKISTCLV